MLIFAGNDQKVEKIERGGLDRNHRFARARLRFRNLGQLQVVGRAESCTQNSLHGWSFIPG